MNRLAIEPSTKSNSIGSIAAFLNFMFKNVWIFILSCKKIKETPPYGKYGGVQVGDLQTMFVGDTDWQDPCP